ncbi:MAG TPA: hypothetical protein VGE11_27190 [Pseudonocardia sp.]
MRRAPWIARPMIGVALALLAGCGGGVSPGPSLPTFPASGTAAATGTATVHDVGVVPDDCARVLPVGELVAVLGLPLNSVAVRTTIGVPAPSVDRLERIDCAYTGTPALGRDQGKPLLAVNAAAYASPAAASAQWKLNAATEDGAHRAVPVGTASGVLVERPGVTLLTVLYGTGTIALTLPARPLPGGTTPADMLVDLARRVLPAMAAAAPPSTAPPTHSSPDPVAPASSAQPVRAAKGT